MLWIKSFHITFMVTWFAGLFYLPRLFVYHAMSEDAASRERFKIMERKLYYGIMTPGALLTISFMSWVAWPSWRGWRQAGETRSLPVIAPPGTVAYAMRVLPRGPGSPLRKADTPPSFCTRVVMS